MSSRRVVDEDEIWETNISAYSGVGYAGTYLKTLYDDWLNGGRLDDLLDNIETQTEERVAGKLQIATTTEDLNQVAASYDLLIGTTQSVILEKLVIRMPTEAAGGAITSITIQTDDVTPSVIINSTDGAVANLTSEAQLSWTGAILIPVGTKIQLTIAGGAHGSTYTTIVVAQCRAVVAGGYLT